MIYYEPHPVSAARKAELRSKGYKIIDARFAPADWKAHDGLQEEEKTKTEAQTETPVKRRGRPRKAS